MKKQKLVFVITKGNWGGAQRYVYDLCTSLKAEYEISVLCGTGTALPEKLSVIGIRTIKIQNLQRDFSFAREFLSFFELYKILQQERPDILHLNSPKAGGIGAVIARFLGIKKIIYTAHGWPFLEERPMLQNVLIRVFSYITALLVHTIITVSENDFYKALWMPFIKHKMRVIHNGIADTEYIDRDFAREYFGVQKQDMVIGAIGELHHNKGFDYLIESFEFVLKEIDTAKLIVIGDGEEKESLESLVLQKGLQDKVLFKGFVPDARAYLKGFDIAVLSSRKEGLPYVVLEYGFAHLPVVSFLVGGVGEIIGEGEGVLVKSGDVALLAKGILQCMEHREYGDNLYKKVVSQFGISEMVENTKRLYRQS